MRSTGVYPLILELAAWPRPLQPLECGTPMPMDIRFTFDWAFFEVLIPFFSSKIEKTPYPDLGFQTTLPGYTYRNEWQKEKAKGLALESKQRAKWELWQV